MQICSLFFSRELPCSAHVVNSAATCMGLYTSIYLGMGLRDRTNPVRQLSDFNAIIIFYFLNLNFSRPIQCACCSVSRVA